MSTLQKLSLALIGTAVMFISANPASAVTLTLGGSTPVTGEGQYTNIQGATTINFNDGTAPTSGPVSFSAPGDINTNIITTSVSGIVNSSVNNGNQSGVYAEPFNDTSDYLAIEPGSDVTINFANAVNYFGLYWGSVDAYNKIDVYSKGSLLATFTGKDVPGAPANGAQSGSANNAYVNLLGGPNQTFDKIVLSSSSPAFETDNYSYALVPEPSSILGLLAFGGFSAGSLLKRKSKIA